MVSKFVGEAASHHLCFHCLTSFVLSPLLAPDLSLEVGSMFTRKLEQVEGSLGYLSRPRALPSKQKQTWLRRR